MARYSARFGVRMSYIEKKYVLLVNKIEKDIAHTVCLQLFVLHHL